MWSLSPVKENVYENTPIGKTEHTSCGFHHSTTADRLKVDKPESRYSLGTHCSSIALLLAILMITPLVNAYAQSEGGGDEGGGDEGGGDEGGGDEGGGDEGGGDEGGGDEGGGDEGSVEKKDTKEDKVTTTQTGSDQMSSTGSDQMSSTGLVGGEAMGGITGPPSKSDSIGTGEVPDVFQTKEDANENLRLFSEPENVDQHLKDIVQKSTEPDLQQGANTIKNAGEDGRSWVQNIVATSARTGYSVIGDGTLPSDVLRTFEDDMAKNDEVAASAFSELPPLEKAKVIRVSLSPTLLTEKIDAIVNVLGRVEVTERLEFIGVLAPNDQSELLDTPTPARVMNFLNVLEPQLMERLFDRFYPHELIEVSSKISKHYDFEHLLNRMDVNNRLEIREKLNISQ